jgi:peptidoglycan-associated lipoprotein
MSPRFHRNLRSALLLAILAGMLAGCSRMPREHWWQFWRRGADPDLTVIADDSFTGPPDPLDWSGTQDSDIYSSGRLSPDEFILDPDDSLISLPEPDPIRQDPEGILVDLRTIYFGYDSFELGTEQMEDLRYNAGWIVDHPELQIRLEGHCDERGTEEYNYNLGQKRAQAVREYLIRNGALEEQLHTWSWGETRPIDPGQGEAAYRRNRRVQFAVWAEQ